MGSSVYKRDQKWISQLPVDYDTSAIANPVVINVWYVATTSLSNGKPAKIWSFMAEQTNNGGLAEDIQVEMDVVLPDGTPQTLAFIAPLDSGVRNFGYIDETLVGGVLKPVLGATIFWFGTGAIQGSTAVPFSFRSVGEVRIRQVSAVDVVSAILEVNMLWERLEVI